MTIVLACDGPGPAGTIVGGDATGQILGVYPTSGSIRTDGSGELTARVRRD